MIIKYFNIAFALIVLIFSVNTHAVNYSITDLGSLGGIDSRGFGINNSKQIVGNSTDITGNYRHGFLWDATSGMQDIGTVGNNAYSFAKDINNNGVVVGYSPPNNDRERASIWDATNGMQYLDVSVGVMSRAESINDNGIVVGNYSTITDGIWQRHAFSWDSDNGMQNLNTIIDSDSKAFDINNNGQIVGLVDTEIGNPHATMWDSTGGLLDLGTLGNGDFSWALGINDNGQVVGGSTDKNNNNADIKAYMWDSVNGMQDLGTPFGYGSQAYGINNNGAIVGNYDDGVAIASAFLWDESNGFQDLCGLVGCTAAGWDKLTFASDVNDNGDIIGFGNIDGNERAFLISTVSTVPVPAAVWLFVSGLLGLIGFARYKN